MTSIWLWGGGKSYYTDENIKSRSFDVVVSCSVIEHLVGMEQIDEFFSLAKPEGTICLHTLICEEVPNDPDWFYLTPEGHCTIWTNRAMSEIYKKGNYIGCAYHLESQMWFFFGDCVRYETLKTTKDHILGTWFFSDQFIDYWKQKPYR